MNSKYDAIAKRLLYDDEASMLKQLYEIEGKPISYIAALMGVSQITARSRILEHNIQPRSRGGAQIKSQVRYYIRLLDQRWFQMEKAETVAQVLRCTHHAVRRYRREM